MKKIIAAIDFSDVTNKVIVKAVELKKAFDAELFIIHSEPPENFVPTEDIPYDYMTEIIQKTEETDRRYLMEIKDNLAKDNIEVHSMLIDGPVAESVLTEAEEFNADLIVIGTHEHGRLYHALFGSIRESILHKSPCPVLVVPLDKEVV